VWVHSEDCCTPLWDEWTREQVVGTFNQGRQTLQNIEIDPTNLPQRFYFQFVFNMGEGNTVSLFTNWYERMCCPTESVLIDASYNGLDCEGNFYGPPEQWLGTSALAHRLTFRVLGSLIETGFSVEREERNGRTTKTTTRKTYELRCEYLPPYMIDRLRVALSAPDLRMNGERVEFSGSAQRATLVGKGGSVVVSLQGPPCNIGSNCN